MDHAESERVSTRERNGLNPRKHSSETLQERVEHARDVVEDVRERAEIVLRERPYILPVAAGAVGLGVGILLGSKLMRFIVFTAVGTALTEIFGGELRRMSHAFIADLRERLAEGDDDEGEGERA